MNKYLEKIAKLGKTISLLSGGRLAKAEGHVNTRLSKAIGTKGKDEVAMRKYTNARLHRDRVDILTSRSRKTAGGIAAGTGAVAAGVAYKAKKKD